MAKGVLCATTPDNKAVYRYDGGGSWTQIQSAYTPYKHFVGTPAGLVASYDFYGVRATLYQPDVDRWVNLFPGALDTSQDDGTYAGTRHGLFRLNDRHDKVEHYDPYGGHFHWSEVGGPASTIVGGAWGLVATNPDSGEVFRYRYRSGVWERISGPVHQVAITPETAYAVSADGYVSFYSGNGQWTAVDGLVVDSLTAGVWGLVAVQRGTGNLYQYLNAPGEYVPQWKQIGGPGHLFAVGTTTVYGLTPAKDAVYEYQPGSGSWTAIGGPADAIAYCGGVDLQA
jgi:hypothetical protein